MDEVSYGHRRRRPATWSPAATIGSAILVGHGLIHLMGVALLWGRGEPGELRFSDVRPAPGSAWAGAVGAGWLAAVLLFAVAAALLVRHRRWRPVAAVAAVVSLAVLAPSASVAATGIAVDGALLLGLLAASWRARAQESWRTRAQQPWRTRAQQPWRARAQGPWPPRARVPR